LRIILQEGAREGALRADLAWELFFESKSELPHGHGARLLPFANWLWDELGKKAGNMNKNSKGEVAVTIPPLGQDGLDFVLRLVSFWAEDVHMKQGDSLSDNLWRRPVVNVLDDDKIDRGESALEVTDAAGSVDRFLMPLLGPGRAFFRVEVIEKEENAARYHSHSGVDEYYLILDGKGTLRYNGKETLVKKGDLIGKPTGPDATSQLVADRGSKLRILDMEVWHQRPYYSKDVILNPDFDEIIMRGPGWGAIVPRESLITSEDFRSHYDEGYKRRKDGGWVPSRNRGHKRIREK
jgi:uncharacterized cupin superfamily protein